jgi:hypothetical protein
VRGDLDSVSFPHPDPLPPKGGEGVTLTLIHDDPTYAADEGGFLKINEVDRLAPVLSYPIQNPVNRLSKAGDEASSDSREISIS